MGDDNIPPWERKQEDNTPPWEKASGAGQPAAAAPDKRGFVQRAWENEPSPEGAGGLPPVDFRGIPGLGLLGRPSIIDTAKGLYKGVTGVGRAIHRQPIPEPTREEDYPEYYEALKRRQQEDDEAALNMALIPQFGKTTTFKGPTAPNPPPGSGPIRDNARLLTEEGRKTRAGQILNKAASDPEAAIESLSKPQEVVPGSEPTTFQATADSGLGSLERAVTANHPEEFHGPTGRQSKQNTARLDALEDVQRLGSPGAVGEHLRDALAAIDAETEAQTKRANYNAWHRTQQLGGQHDPEIHGAVLRQELRTAEEAVRTHENNLWQRIDPEGRFWAGVGPLREVYESVYGPLSRAERSTLSPAERQIEGLINSYEGAVPFREIDGLRKVVSSEMRQELSTNGRTAAYGRLSRLRAGLQDSIVNRVIDIREGEFTTEASRRLGEAIEATQRRAGQYEADPISKVLQREGAHGPYTMPGSAVPKAIFKPGPTGYESVNNFLNATRDAIPMLRDAAVDSMRKVALDSNGQINQARLNRWMDQHADALRAITDRDGGHFVESLREAGRATQTMEDVAANRQMIRDQATQGVFGKLIGMTDPQEISRTIGGIFNGGPSSISQARALGRALQGNKAALEGAQRAVIDFVKEKFLTTQSAAPGENLISSNAFQKWFRANRTALKELGFSDEQLGNWGNIADDLNRASSTTKIPGSSNTVQDYLALQKTGLKPTTLSKLLTYFGTMATGAAGLHGAGFSGMLGAVGGILGGGLMMFLREAGITKVDELVKQAMLHPEFARELLLRAQSKPTNAMSPRLKKAVRTMGAFEYMDSLGTGTTPSQGEPLRVTVRPGGQ